MEKVMKNIVSKIKPLVKRDPNYDRLLPCSLCGTKPKLIKSKAYDKEKGIVRIYYYQHAKNGCESANNYPVWRWYTLSVEDAIQNWNTAQLKLRGNNEN